MWCARSPLFALCLLLCASCGTLNPVTARPPDPPADLMQPCPPWPVMAGAGDVEPGQLVDAIVAAKLAHHECASRAGLLQRYVRDVQ